jgi:serine/threonine protein kinase
MPHLFFGGFSDDKSAPDTQPRHAPSTAANTHDEHEHDKENMWERTWKHMGNWLKKEDENEAPSAAAEQAATTTTPASPPPSVKEERQELSEKVETVPCRPSHNVIPSLPRPITFKRQDSERRERLYPHEPDHEERRATSADRRLGSSYDRRISPLCLPQIATSIPKPLHLDRTGEHTQNHPHDFASTAGTVDGQHSDRPASQDLDTNSHYDWHPHPHPHHDALQTHSEHLSDALSDLQLQTELDARWILNLSMHFRDHSLREKFFITYAETPSLWRRVTVSVDYRYAPVDSLEADLKSLHYQRDKAARIYESIRDSLCGIQFYPSVTNLKLETSGGRLHVHVTEDVNEIIEYPHIDTVAHLELPEYSEEAIEFDCHMSGFVYKVRTIHHPYHEAKGELTLIKKEIPGPEAIEEFLYEINALSALRDRPNIVRIHGLVIDNHDRVKGILLEYCPHGALVDILYDSRLCPTPNTVPLSRRLRWARQTALGLSEIHAAGFVQGDFTLSNIVIDSDDNARIIDINRRGCPIGWEPPELGGLIRAGVRVGLYIGVKSDVYQLGMVLWALGEGVDEPERVERPLRFSQNSKVPAWYREVVEGCLKAEPRGRFVASEVLARFPSEEEIERELGPQSIPVVEVEVPTATPGAISDFLPGERTNGLLASAPEVRLPSPLASAPPADINKDVEYLLSSAQVSAEQLPEAHKSSMAGAESSGHDEPEQRLSQQDQPCGYHDLRNASMREGESQLKETTEPLRTDRSGRDATDSASEPLLEVASAAPLAMPKPLDPVQPELLNTTSKIPAIDAGAPALQPEDPSGTASSMLEERSRAGSVAASAFVPGHAADTLGSAPMDLGFPPLATISPPTAVPAPAPPLLDSIAPASRPVEGSPEIMDLGFPPLATISPPPPLSTHNSSEAVPLSTGATSHTSRGVSLDLANPSLAIISPPPAISPQNSSSAVPVLSSTSSNISGSPALDLGSPPLATLSPLPQGSCPVDIPSAVAVEAAPSALPPKQTKTEELFPASSTETTTPLTALALGNPPLATLSPPAQDDSALAPLPKAEQEGISQTPPMDVLPVSLPLRDHLTATTTSDAEAPSVNLDAVWPVASQTPATSLLAEALQARNLASETTDTPQPSEKQER